MTAKKRTSDASAGWGQAFWLSLIVIGVLLSLASYNPEDPSFSTFSNTWHTPRNVLGYFGSWIADALFQIGGYSIWFGPALLVTALIRWLISSDREEVILSARWWIGLGLLMSSTCLFTDLMSAAREAPLVNSAGTSGPGAPFPVQGLWGIALSAVIKPFLGSVGSYLAVVALAWCFCMAWWETLPGHFARILMAGFEVLREKLPAFKHIPLPQFNLKKKPASDGPAVHASLAAKLAALSDDDESEEEEEETPRGSEKTPLIRQAKPLVEKTASSKKESSEAPRTPTSWETPPLSLLEYSKKKAKPLTQEQLLAIANKISNALRSFEIEGEITEISPGPIITMYEFQPAPGVRVQKIISAQTDLAMTLGVPSVRIVAPIPGKSVAGIEVPNPDKEEIVLRDVYESTIERAKLMKLPMTLGKDGEGRPVMEDLSRMPHLLIGGATSMGKSVLVNSLLTGLLCRFTPEELRLIIVDPKLVEFKAFEDIPHLMLPIVNDPNDASQSLKWAVGETKRRYLLMQKLGGKNIEAYNQKVTEFDLSTLKEGEKAPSKFPYIVIIIDELAELMLTGKKDVEQSIVRLSQLARAAGIHLIMSTQRPSADVVTGLIKSNCPSRVALRVASASDSRIVLDCAGAEQLLGKGDMFFTNTGPMGLRRMQGAYVSDAEIEKICDFWRNQGEPEYKEEILAPEESELEKSQSSQGTDELYQDVIEFAKDKGKISTSLIQRRFQIGYTRAARIMEQLEERGIVGEPSAAGKARDVMI